MLFVSRRRKRFAAPPGSFGNDELRTLSLHFKSRRARRGKRPAQGPRDLLARPSCSAAPCKELCACVRSLKNFGRHPLKLFFLFLSRFPPGGGLRTRSSQRLTRERTQPHQGSSDEHTHAITIAQERGDCSALAHVRPQPSHDRRDQFCNDRRMS